MNTLILLEITAAAVQQPRVPALIGMSLMEARQAVASVGLTINVAATAVNPQFPPDIIVAQSPTADTPAVAGATVNVTLNSPLRITAFSASPRSVPGGKVVTLTIQLSSTIHDGAVIHLKDDSTLVVLPATVTVPANTGSITFTAQTRVTERTVEATLVAELHGASFEHVLTVAEVARAPRFQFETEALRLLREAEAVLHPIAVTITGGTRGESTEVSVALLARQLIEGQRAPVVKAPTRRVRSDVRRGEDSWVIRLAFAAPGDAELKLSIENLTVRAEGRGTIALTIKMEPESVEFSPRSLPVALVR